MVLENNKYRINIEIDTTYTVKSTDNREYDLIFQVEDYPKGHMYKAFSIAIVNEETTHLIAIVGSCYSEPYHCATLEDNRLVVLMDNTIIFIDIERIKIIKSILINDFGICFALYRFKNGYIVHGELEVIKLDLNANVEWRFSGADIFATSKEDNFTVLENEIIVEDWQGYIYHIDENGHEIKNTK
jgi:hypothetical protein